MADGMPGMSWKEALKRLKEFHQAGADGSPASMQKELEGLEESLKGWETRDERRGRTLEIYRQDSEKLRAKCAKFDDLANDVRKDLREVYLTLSRAGDQGDDKAVLAGIVELAKQGLKRLDAEAERKS